MVNGWIDLYISVSIRMTVTVMSALAAKVVTITETHEYRNKKILTAGASTGGDLEAVCFHLVSGGEKSPLKIFEKQR